MRASLLPVPPEAAVSQRAYAFLMQSFTDLLLVPLNVALIILFCTVPSHKELWVGWSWVTSQWACRKHFPTARKQPIYQGPFNSLLLSSRWVYCSPVPTSTLYETLSFYFLFCLRHLILGYSCYFSWVLSFPIESFSHWTLTHTQIICRRLIQKYMLLPRYEDEAVILVPLQLGLHTSCLY